MIKIKSFVFSPFYENTYVVSDDSGKCIVIDPGCYESWEKKELTDYIDGQGFEVEKIVNTHCHVDHVFGNAHLVNKYKVPLVAHEKDLKNLRGISVYAEFLGIKPDPSPDPDVYFDEGDDFGFGDTKLEIYFTPGHAPGHVVLFHRESNQLFGGDVLFRRSIGRTDLPGGDYDTLMRSIIEKVLPLGDDVTVYSGHGEPTTIGEERRMNPFILQYLQ